MSSSMPWVRTYRRNSEAGLARLVADQLLVSSPRMWTIRLYAEAARLGLGDGSAKQAGTRPGECKHSERGVSRYCTWKFSQLHSRRPGTHSPRRMSSSFGNPPHDKPLHLHPPSPRSHEMQHTVSLIPTVNANTVRSFSSHGQQSAANGSSTTVSRSDTR
jgi:hypothetical protein